MKVAQFGVLTNPVLRTTSHNYGWTCVINELLKQSLSIDTVDVLKDYTKLDEYDIICINEGVNYAFGKYNLMGGVLPIYAEKINALNNFKGRIITFHDKVDYNHFVENKKLDATFTKTIEHYNSNSVSKKLVIGDSHSVSVFQPGYAISRNDGKTMYGALKQGLSSFIHKDTEELVVYFGNIDIRHHILRHKEWTTIVNDMVNDLILQLNDLNLKKVTFVEALLIEDESRIIPKSGFYKGTPFYGSYKKRDHVRSHFNMILSLMSNTLNCEYEIIDWNHLYSNPDLYDFNQEHILDFKHMEGKKSFHLRPESYKYKGWTNTI